MRFCMTHASRSREEIARYYNVGCPRLACFQLISLSIASIHDHPSPPPPSPPSLLFPGPFISYSVLSSLSLSQPVVASYFGGSPSFSFPRVQEIRRFVHLISTDLSTPMGARSIAAWPFIVVYKLARITRDHTYTHTYAIYIHAGCPIQEITHSVNRAGSGPRFNSTFHGFSSVFFAVRCV